MCAAVFCCTRSGGGIFFSSRLFGAGPFDFAGKVQSVGSYPFVEALVELVVMDIVLGLAAFGSDGEDLGKAKFVRGKVVDKKLNSDSARDIPC